MYRFVTNGKGAVTDRPLGVVTDIAEGIVILASDDPGFVVGAGTTAQ
jgi:hypothetical protein